MKRQVELTEELCCLRKLERKKAGKLGRKKNDLETRLIESCGFSSLHLFVTEQ